MKKYRIVIEETISEEFEIQATSEEEAISKAINEYHEGNFVLSPGNVEYRQIAVIGEDDEIKDWIEF